ncbi:MAG TPA: DMT family transporter [Afifellaceae bacterium]|nr:DMT family transporter [Afifellaceae bacterium]
MASLLSWFWRQPYLLLTLTPLFWAGNAVIGRAVVGEVPPAMLSEIRWTGALLVFLPFAWKELKADWPVILRRLPILALLAFAGLTSFNTILYWALQYTTAVNTSLLQSAMPLVIGLWSLALFSDPLSRFQYAGLALSLAGVAAVIAQGDLGRLVTLDFNRGDVAMLLAVSLYAFYSAVLRKRPPISASSFLAITIALAVVMLAPVVAVEAAIAPTPVPTSLNVWLALAYMIVFPSLLAYAFFTRGVELIGANRAGPFFHLIPLFAAILEVAFLGERLALYHGIGAAFILGGVALASRRRSIAGPEAAPPPGPAAAEPEPRAGREGPNTP